MTLDVPGLWSYPREAKGKRQATSRRTTKTPGTLAKPPGECYLSSRRTARKKEPGKNDTRQNETHRVNYKQENKMNVAYGRKTDGTLVDISYHQNPELARKQAEKLDEKYKSENLQTSARFGFQQANSYNIKMLGIANQE